jgi:hypothetical protein
MEYLERKTMLGHYLAGLIEGDGSIVVPKTRLRPTKKAKTSAFLGFIYK